MMIRRCACLVLIAAALAGCSMALPRVGAPSAATRSAATPSAAERIAAECRLLEAAAVQFTAQDGLREGCPGVSARDTRPLRQQMASLRAANAAALPAGIAAGSRAEIVVRRMITRGVPLPVVAGLVTTEDFQIAAR